MATIYTTDYSKLTVDETGRAQLTIGQGEVVSGPEGEIETITVWRFDLDPCTYNGGILSDNPYHPEMPAWFASRQDPINTAAQPARTYADLYGEDNLGDVADSIDVSRDHLILALISPDPVRRAWAYESIGGYFGFDNFDGCPLTLTEREFCDLLSAQD